MMGSPQIFSTVTVKFSTVASLSLKIVLLRLKSHTRTFSTVTMKLGTFSIDTMKFSTAWISKLAAKNLPFFFCYKIEHHSRHRNVGFWVIVSGYGINRILI